MSNLKSHQRLCPKCGAVAECEMADIGVGEHQVTSFKCTVCDWDEADEVQAIERDYYGN